MAFYLGDILIDRILYGVAENNDGDVLYLLTQLSEASINITAESTDITDAQGTLIKRFYRGKTGEFSATNALVNLNVIAAASGVDPELASDGNKIVMPKMITVMGGTTGTILTGYVTGTAKVNVLNPNGSLGESIALGSAQGEDEFFITSGKELKLPTGAKYANAQFVVKYDREVTQGAKISNNANAIPASVKLTLKVLAMDPCNKTEYRALYVELPSFQVSPETSVNLQSEGGIDFNGSLEVDYCSVDKSLYRIYLADEEDGE